MEISINHIKTTVEENTSLTAVVALNSGENTKGIAVAVNENVVPKNEWDNTILHQNDTVIIIKATQGG
jgi:sulfur carrier protein